MCRPPRTPGSPNPNNPRSSQPSRTSGHGFLVGLCASLALAGVVAAAAAVAAAALSILPANASAVKNLMPMPGRGPVRHDGLIGLNHSGGDLRRAVRLTRSARRISRGQFRTWADRDLIMPVQATYQVMPTRAVY
jgi:hypothetical protein